VRRMDQTQEANSARQVDAGQLRGVQEAEDKMNRYQKLVLKALAAILWHVNRGYSYKSKHEELRGALEDEAKRG